MRIMILVEKTAPRDVDTSATRVRSQWGYGLRSHAVFAHGYENKREIKVLTNHLKGRNRAKRLGNEGGWVGKHPSWKDNRDKQFKCRDKRHESDPNPVHLDL